MRKAAALVLLAVLISPGFGQTAITIAGTPVQPPLTFSDGSGLAPVKYTERGPELLETGDRYKEKYRTSSVPEYPKKTDPETFAKLFISKGFDSHHTRSFVVSKASPLTEEELSGFIKDPAASGKLKEIDAKYGLTPPSY